MSWIQRWIDKHLGGNALLQAPPREWRPLEETLSAYVADVIRNRYGMTARRDIDLPLEQFETLLRQTMIVGSTTISELVVITQNGPVRVRARDGGTVGFTTILGPHSETSFRTGHMSPWPDPGPGDESPLGPRGFGAKRETLDA